MTNKIEGINVEQSGKSFPPIPRSEARRLKRLCWTVIGLVSVFLAFVLAMGGSNKQTVHVVGSVVVALAMFIIVCAFVKLWKAIPEPERRLWRARS